jgi:hypothetical protein
MPEASLTPTCHGNGGPRWSRTISPVSVARRERRWMRVRSDSAEARVTPANGGDALLVENVRCRVARRCRLSPEEVSPRPSSSAALHRCRISPDAVCGPCPARARRGEPGGRSPSTARRLGDRGFADARPDGSWHDPQGRWLPRIALAGPYATDHGGLLVQPERHIRKTKRSQRRRGPRQRFVASKLHVSATPPFSRRGEGCRWRQAMWT